MTQPHTYRLRVSDELYKLLCVTAAECSRYYDTDVNDIVRKTVRWVSKYGTQNVVQSKEMGNVLQKRSAVMIQTKNCDKPLCSSDEFKKVLAYRCLDALEKIKYAYKPFVPDSSQKYIIKEEYDDEENN